MTDTAPTGAPTSEQPNVQPNVAAAADPNAWTVRRIIDWTKDYLSRHGSDSPRVEAEILLSHAWNCDRILLYTRFEQAAPDRVREQMRDLVRRRASNEPVAYLVGHREFHSLKFAVSPAVLVPRPETETLVEEALEFVRGAASPVGEADARPEAGADDGGSQPEAPPVARPVSVLDLGTGSGCLAVTIAKRCPSAAIDAVDLSPDAIAIAATNAERHDVSDRVRFLEGDLFEPVGGGAYDLIVSNPPYVTTDEMPTLDADVRDHEPHLALDGGADGLDVARRLIADAPQHLRAAGALMLELDPAQMRPASELLTAAGFVRLRTARDLSGRQRVLVGYLEDSA